MQDQTELLATLESSTRTGVHVVGLRITTYALSFAGSIVIARALGPEGRGRYTLPLAVLAIAFTVGNLGLEHAQVYLAGQGVPLPRLWANATAVGFTAGLLVWGLIGIVALTAGTHIFGIPITWLAITVAQLPLMLHTLYWLNLLQLGGKVRAGVAASCVAALMQTLAAVALFAMNDLTPFRVLILIGATNAITWVITLGFGMRAGLVSWRIDRSVLRSGLRFGMKAQLGIVFVFLLLRVDQVMVQRILGFHDLGIYSLAVTLAELMWLLSDPFAAALLPHQVAATGDDDLRLGYATSRLALLLVATIATIAWVTCPVIIRLAYGTDFNEAVWPFRMLLPGIVALSIQRPLAGVLLKRGRPGLVTTFGAGALLINVACNLLLLPSMGVVAASIGSTVAYVFLASTYVATTRRAGVTEPRDLVPRRADLNLLARAFRSALARTES